MLRRRRRSRELEGGVRELKRLLERWSLQRRVEARSWGTCSSGAGSAPDRLQTRGTPKPRKAVVDDNPVGPIVEVDVKLGRPVDRTVHVGQNDVDLVGVAGRLAKERTPAPPAERSRAVVG